MKKEIRIEIEESLLEWIEEQIRENKFESLSQAIESAILYRKERFGKKPKKIRECVACEKKFTEGWNPKFDKEHGICQRCLKRFEARLKLSDMSPKEREEELIGIFRDNE